MTFYFRENKGFADGLYQYLLQLFCGNIALSVVVRVIIQLL